MGSVLADVCSMLTRDNNTIYYPESKYLLKINHKALNITSMDVVLVSLLLTLKKLLSIKYCSSNLIVVCEQIFTQQDRKHPLPIRPKTLVTIFTGRMLALFLGGIKREHWSEWVKARLQCRRNAVKYPFNFYTPWKRHNFFTPWKCQKNEGFLTFSRDIEMESFSNILRGTL